MRTQWTSGGRLTANGVSGIALLCAVDSTKYFCIHYVHSFPPFSLLLPAHLRAPHFPHLSLLFPYSRSSIILVKRTSFGAFITIRTQRIFSIIIQYHTTTLTLSDWLSCFYHHVFFSSAGTGFDWRLYTYNFVHVFMLCDPLYYVIDVSVTNIITFCRPSSLE